MLVLPPEQDVSPPHWSDLVMIAGQVEQCVVPSAQGNANLEIISAWKITIGITSTRWPVLECQEAHFSLCPIISTCFICRYINSSFAH